MLLSAGVLGIAASCGTSRLDQRPATVIACALSVGIFTYLAISVLGRTSRTMFVPARAFIGLVRERLSHDATSAVIVVQFASTALVGLVLAALHRQPVTGVPDLWSWDNLRELAAAGALALAARHARRASPFWIAAVFAIAMISGARFLGNPAFLIGDAFAGLTSGGGMKIGPVLAAQTVGIVIGVALPRFGGPDLAAVADRPS